MDNLKSCFAQDIRGFNNDDVSKWAEVFDPGVCKYT